MITSGLVACFHQAALTGDERKASITVNPGRRVALHIQPESCTTQTAAPLSSPRPAYRLSRLGTLNPVVITGIKYH